MQGVINVESEGRGAAYEKATTYKVRKFLMKDSVRVKRRKTFYELCVKRPIDILCSLLAIICFSWLFLIIAFLVRVKLGSPVIFKQKRPGLNERIFTLYKFRTMTDEKDADGKLLPDEVRLTPFGKWLRGTSMDELPEAFNILKGDMSIVGPRPQLVRDMVFMSDNQRRRHTAVPGLTGLAQVNGRNGIPWEEKLAWDLKYIEKITFSGDIRIIFRTVKKVFFKQEGICREGTTSDMDFGDYLLEAGKIDRERYEEGQREAENILLV